jgi:hypothetical protein
MREREEREREGEESIVDRTRYQGAGIVATETCMFINEEPNFRW